MGKYRRYKNIIEMFLSSEKGKRVLNFCSLYLPSNVRTTNIIGKMYSRFLNQRIR